MANLRETAGQDILQKPADELGRIDSYLSPVVRAASAIREGYLVLLTRHDSPVADGDAKDLRGEVLQRGLAVCNRLGMNDPILLPDHRINLGKQVGSLEGIAKLGAEKDGQPRTGTKKSARKASHCEPFALIPPPGTT
jgi:hypothetical protein